MLFRDAFEKAKIGQYIKATGDAFFGNVEFYQKVGRSSLNWSIGSVGGNVPTATLKRLMDSDRDIYGVYEDTSEFTRIY